MFRIGDVVRYKSKTAIEEDGYVYGYVEEIINVDYCWIRTFYTNDRFTFINFLLEKVNDGYKV